MHFVTLDPIIVSSLVFFIGVGVTYVGNAFWAFDREKSHAQTAPKYIACYFIGYLVQIGILAFLTKVFDVSHFFAQLVGMGGAAVTIFVLLNFWVFRGDQADLS
jgi:putative flippase GtrA